MSAGGGCREEGKVLDNSWQCLGAVMLPIGSHGSSIVDTPSSPLQLLLTDTGDRVIGPEQTKYSKYTDLFYTD